MKVLVVGSGGREHALCWALDRSPSVSDVVVVPGNDGMENAARVIGGAGDERGVRIVADAERPDLVVIGPEAPLVAGWADALRRDGYAVLGPGAAGARLEGSKRYAKEFMERHGVPTARFAGFDDLDDALAHLERVGAPIVVKDSGLRAGKGVTVAETLEEARTAVEAIFQEPGAEVVLEERLAGPEISVTLLVDANTHVALPPSRDHKRAYDGGRGPNTGGMGAVAPVPLSAEEREALERQVVKPVMRGLRADGVPYSGVLYVGVMRTEDGFKVLEFNCRFGDPETQVLMPLLASDAGELFRAVAEDRLAEVEVRVAPGASACVVMAAPGYPGSPKVGVPVGLPRELPEGTLLFSAGLHGRPPVSKGGRVVNAVGIGATVAEAVRRAYRLVDAVRFEGALVRRDIGAGM
ncbi:MAG TPA: phosphoribosylamine--glycine ligase [Trueperaceae bacterium]